MVHLTDHMGGKTCCSLAVCAQFVQRKVILAYCGHMIAHRSNMPQVFRWCLHAVVLATVATTIVAERAQRRVEMRFFFKKYIFLKGLGC